ncbi:MAG TPA: antibiotic biosynthesis monooxygenase family protein [Gaiellaceae bacterium]|jgi:quinol monooxygenase YgiN
MIVEYIRYTIDPGRAQEFEEAYRRAAQALEASDHCLAYEVTRCSEDASQQIVRIEWDSAEGHLNGFRRSPEFQPFFEAVRPFVDSIDEMRHYDVLFSGAPTSV